MKLSAFTYFAAFGIKTILFRQKKPILGTVILTDKCNLKCKHCSVNNITAVIHPYSQIRNEMQTLYSMGCRILFFCGGETFLWRDGEKSVRDLVIEAKQMNFLIVNVVTTVKENCVTRSLKNNFLNTLKIFIPIISEPYISEDFN